MITLSPDGPWDFINRFPAPLPEVVEAGLIDADPESIEAIHIEQIHELVATCHDCNYVRDCRNSGIDPRTGKQSRRLIKPEEWHQLLRTGWRSYLDCINVYADAFGRDAGAALKRFCIAMVEGVMVIETGSDQLIAPAELHAIANDAEKNAGWIAFFDAHCPSVWATGARMWNADKVGRYKVGFQTSYDPDHPYYYYQAGRPLSVDQLIESVPPVETDDLGHYVIGKNRKRDFEVVLNQYRQRMAESTASYTTLYAHGPKGLSAFAKTHGSYDKTPMTIWGESMALLARQIMHQVSVIKAIESHLGMDWVETSIIQIGGQMSLFEK